MSLRIGIIGGLGHVGHIVRGVEELQDTRICAIAPGCEEEDGTRLRKLVAPGQDVNVYDDYRLLLDRENLDIVGVAPRYDLHAEIAGQALNRGISVFCEKPIALNLESLERLRKAQAEAGKPIGMMMASRYAPSFSTARRLVADGQIGVPTVGYSQKSYRRGNRPDFFKRRDRFGGIIPWVGIHAIDWFHWVSGVDYAAVSARHVKLHRPDYPDLEDAATCLFELRNGGSCIMSFDYLRPAGAPTHGDDRLRLLGEKGAIEVWGMDRVELITTDGVQPIETDPPSLGLFADFARSVVDPSHQPRITTADAFRMTEIALLARDAADGNRRIEFS